MRWLLAVEPEVIGRADQPAAEMMLPEPIHVHAGGERVAGVGDPLGQLEPAVGGFRVAGRRSGSADRGAGIIDKSRA